MSSHRWSVGLAAMDGVRTDGLAEPRRVLSGPPSLSERRRTGADRPPAQRRRAGASGAWIRFDAGRRPPLLRNVRQRSMVGLLACSCAFSSLKPPVTSRTGFRQVWSSMHLEHERCTVGCGCNGLSESIARRHVRVGLSWLRLESVRVQVDDEPRPARCRPPIVVDSHP